MPHLSPMNWLLAPLLFLIVALPFLMSALWWSQTPSLPNIIKPSITPQTSWKWN